VLSAYVHEHRLAAVRGGREVWNFVAGGRIGSPPVVFGGLAVFGCHDGHVYAVRLEDGTPAWRFLAAPADRRHVVMGQMESVWPVFNVVLHEGKLYCSAGRHPEFDNGIHFYCLDPRTGELQWHVRHLRGLSTESLTPRRSSASTMAHSKNEPLNEDASWVINDVIEVRDGKVWLGDLPMVDLADPRDAIINPETVAPPYLGPGARCEPDADDVPALIESLDDPHLVVRLDAAFKLGQLGSEATTAVPTLAKLLGARDAATRLVAIRALTKIGVVEPVMAELLTAAGDADAELRESAGVALGMVGDAATSGLIKLMDAPDPAVARDAARTLGRIDAPLDASAVPGLMVALKTEVDETRRLCRESASKHRDPQIAAAHHQRMLSRRINHSLIVQALGRTGDTGKRAVAAFAKDGDPVVRAYAQAIDRTAGD
jgi:HEAT repeat protein